MVSVQVCMDDRVVWLSDDGPEYGFVRWIGHVPGSDDDYIAGVEFVSFFLPNLTTCAYQRT